MKKLSIGAICVALAGSGCAGFIEHSQAQPAAPSSTPEERLQKAWHGRPAVDMEAHPVFSAMQIRRQDVSDGTVIMHHLRCASWREDDQVVAFGGPHITNARVHHGEEGTVCCDRQFIVRAGVVETYRQVPSRDGTCTAEAIFYPDGKRPDGL